MTAMLQEWVTLVDIRQGFFHNVLFAVVCVPLCFHENILANCKIFVYEVRNEGKRRVLSNLLL